MTDVEAAEIEDALHKHPVLATGSGCWVAYDPSNRRYAEEGNVVSAAPCSYRP
jgi:hypothetical protein